VLAVFLDETFVERFITYLPDDRSMPVGADYM